MVKKKLKRRAPKRKSPSVALKDIHAALASERRGYLRKRLLILKSVLSGRSCIIAARRAGVDVSTAQRWVKRYRAGGLEQLRKTRPGMLSPEQIAEVSTLIQAKPEIRWKELCAVVKRRFGLAYSVTGLLRRVGKKACHVPEGTVRDPLPGVNARDIDAALVGEDRPYIRKRLLAVQAILSGATREQAARQVRAGVGSVYRWMMIRRGGLAAFVRGAPGLKPKDALSPSQVEKLRRDLSGVLEGSHDAEERKRLTAVLKVLSGKAMYRVATELHVKPASVAHWMKKLRRRGAASLRMPVRVPTIEADPAALRRLASGERDHRFVERLWAVAGLAEGRTLSDVARRSGVHRVTLNAWCKAYRRGGIDALRPREPCIVRRRPRLNPAQLDELAALIRARPGLSRWQLWEIVKRRFGFDYTLDGLMRLVREELGFVRVGDRLVSA